MPPWYKRRICASAAHIGRRTLIFIVSSMTCHQCQQCAISFTTVWQSRPTARSSGSAGRPGYDWCAIRTTSKTRCALLFDLECWHAARQKALLARRVALHTLIVWSFLLQVTKSGIGVRILTAASSAPVIMIPYSTHV